MLRSQTGDLAALSNERKFSNEVLEAALFNGIQAHNRSLTWGTLPLEQEQMVLILAKARLCRDKAMEYSLEAKLNVGSSMGRDKTSNGYALMQMASMYQEEYEYLKEKLESSPDGDIHFGTLVRESRTRRMVVPSLLATPPAAPVLHSVQYRYDPDLMQGKIRYAWERITDPHIAFVRVYLSRTPSYELGDAIKTIYDLAYHAPPPSTPMSAGTPQLPQVFYEQEYTILPTGYWYLILAAFNWNALFSLSAAHGFAVVNSRSLRADLFAVGPAEPLTTTTTTTSTTTTTTTT